MITESRIRTIEPDITIFEISGRLNLGNLLVSMETSLRRLIDEGARKLVVDVTNLSYIDSSGIGMLVGCNGHIDQNGGRMRIAGAQGLVAKAFQVVHLDLIIQLDADVAMSCQNFAAGSATA